MSGSTNRHDQPSSSNPVLLTPATANPGSRASSRAASSHTAHDAHSLSQGPSSPLVLLPGEIAAPQNVVSPSRDTEGRQVVGGPLNYPYSPFDGDRMLSRIDVIGVRYKIVNTIPRTNDRRMKPCNFFFDVTNKQGDKQYVIKTVKHTENAEYKNLRILHHISSDLNGQHGAKHIVLLHDFENYGLSHHFLIFEKMDCTLFEYSRNETITLKQIRPMMKQMLYALKYLRIKAIVHRDISPHNIMLVNRDSKITFKLGGFGLAVQAGTSPNFNGNNYVNLQYLSPEVVMSNELQNESDVWSVGSVALEMYFRENIFSCEQPEELMFLFFSAFQKVTPAIAKKYSSRFRALDNVKLEENTPYTEEKLGAIRTKFRSIKSQEQIENYSGEKEYFNELIKKIFVYGTYGPIPAATALKHDFFTKKPRAQPSGHEDLPNPPPPYENYISRRQAYQEEHPNGNAGKELKLEDVQMLDSEPAPTEEMNIGEEGGNKSFLNCSC